MNYPSSNTLPQKFVKCVSLSFLFGKCCFVEMFPKSVTSYEVAGRCIFLTESKSILQIGLQIFSKHTHNGEFTKGSKPDLNMFKAILMVDFRTKQPGAWVRSVEVPIDGPNRSIGLPRLRIGTRRSLLFQCVFFNRDKGKIPPTLECWWIGRAGMMQHVTWNWLLI